MQVALSNDLRWKARGDYEIFVEHGPVIYLDGEKIERAMQDLFYEQQGYILPFVKRDNVSRTARVQISRSCPVTWKGMSSRTW